MRISSEELETLEDGFREVERKLAIDRLSVEIVTAFGSRGIKTPLLKGAVLGEWLYPGEVHPYYNSALMIAPGDRARSVRVLERLGFQEYRPWMPSPRQVNEEWPIKPTRPLTRAAKVRLAAEIVCIYLPTRALDLLPTDSSCLTRPVVLTRLLSRQGIEASLVIGVSSDGDSVAAYGWVEHRGIPLLDPGPDDLARLIQLDVPNEQKHNGEPNW